MLGQEGIRLRLMIRDKKDEIVSAKHKTTNPKRKNLSPMSQAIDARAEAGKALGLAGPAPYDFLFFLFPAFPNIRSSSVRGKQSNT